MNQMLPEKNNPEKGQRRTDKINGIRHPERSNVQQYVTYSTTANGNSHTGYISTKPVKLFGDARRMPLMAKANVPINSRIWIKVGI